MNPNKIEELKQVLKNQKDPQGGPSAPNGSSTSPASPGEDRLKTDETVQQAQDQAREAQDKYLRLYAEFENFKKRAVKERTDIASHTQAKVVEEVLPVLDDLERALEHAKKNADLKVLITGIDMVKKQFQNTLQQMGLVVFDSLGQSFDPNLHEAVAHMESQDYDEGQVMTEYRKGYKMGEKLLRPAMVAVAKASHVKNGSEGK